jgi:hypothetical protein
MGYTLPALSVALHAKEETNVRGTRRYGGRALPRASRVSCLFDERGGETLDLAVHTLPEDFLETVNIPRRSSICV